MNIDLAALPDDVETLRRMVRSLAAERTALSEAQAEIERLRLIVQKLQRSQLAGELSGLTKASCSSGLRTSKPISRGPRPGCHQVRRRPPAPSCHNATAQASRRTYLARTGGSISSIRLVPAAVANCI
jgi:hypothetical protein